MEREGKLCSFSVMADLEKQDKGGVDGDEEEEEETESLIEGMPVLDFDMLCSTVALQTQGKWTRLESVDVGDEEKGGDSGGVLRMWEGEVLGCFEGRRIAIESACCPCYRFGKNMRRAGFGPCFIQGIVYFILIVTALVNFIAYIVTKRHCFLYFALAFTISVGIYLGFFRTQIRRKFNIRGSDSFLDDCIYHLICPICALCQESRTLEMNNVQDGTWHGRGDTLCIHGYSEGNKTFLELHPPPLVSITTSAPLDAQKNGNSSDPL